MTNAQAWASIGVAMLAVAIVANQRAAVLDLVAADGNTDAVPIPDDPTDSDGEQGQGGGTVDTVLAALDPATYLPAMTTPDQATANTTAFLLMLRKSEGTDGPDGYRTMFGYRYFDDFSDHPRQPAQFTDGNGRRLWTSAAGAYQFMARSPLPGGGSTTVDTWDRMKAKLGLPDFSPASQDAAAIGLIDGAGALNDVKAGRVETAISKVRGIWASLPGAGYGQPERTLATLEAAYTAAGGAIA